MSAPLPPPDFEIGRIGCLMLNGVGDIVCCLPALAALKDRYPRARLIAIVRPHLVGLVQSNPAVDGILPFGSSSLGARFAFLHAVRRERFDLWVDLHTPTFNTVTSQTRHLLRNALLMRWSGARFRRAYAAGPLRPWLTHSVAVPSEARLREASVVELTLALAWPRADRSYEKRFPVTAIDAAWAGVALPDSCMRRIGLYFGTRQPAKGWSESASVRLAQMIVSSIPETEIVLIGDRSDAPRAARLIAGLNNAGQRRAHNFTGKSTFGQTAALIARLDAIVSTDSGPMHIADALGVPIVALFSSHNYPRIWAPLNNRSVVIHHEIECGPCLLAVCPVGNRCMERITPEEVLAALVGRLERRAGRQPA